MAAGKPAVATAVGIAPEIIKNGENGFLVKPGDSAGIAEAVSILLSGGNKIKEMGVLAKEAVKNRFSYKRMIEEYQKVYESLVDR